MKNISTLLVKGMVLVSFIYAGSVSPMLTMRFNDVSGAAGTTENEEGTHMGISYNVNDDVSIGYTRQETDFSGTSSDEEHSGFQASYSMGSISFGGRVGKVSNMGGTAGSSDTDKHITMSIAF